MLEGESKYKMLCAIIRMAHSNQKQRVKIPSRVYERVKIEKAAMHFKLYSGKNNPQYGKKHSEETKQKLREACRAKASKEPKPQVTCPHCGITGGAPPMRRWYFDNCKYK